jgi:RHS repeat-associated protein
MGKPNSNQTSDTSNNLGFSPGKAASESKAISIPQINLPKGGGALKGIDEKFSVNAVNGTAGFSIPFPFTPGRNGFQPAITLNYNSGYGNSAFGLGWSAEYPSIQRKTDKKLPRYIDAADSDVFMFTGAEDLVPSMKEINGEWKIDEQILESYSIRRYRPRIEGLFARIERIKSSTQRTFYWKITTRENIVTYFGKSPSHQIADPANPSRVFKWLPEISFDDKGNCIAFEYKEENLDNVTNTTSEKNRINRQSTFANKYLKKVRYGNIQPFFPDYSKLTEIYETSSPSDTEFLFHALFDYGEHINDTPEEDILWNRRPDAFSDYRAGFEIRTYRLCKRMIMFHHFTKIEFGLGNDDTRIFYAVRSLDMLHTSSSASDQQSAEVTYLSSIRETGYKKNTTGYNKKSLPAMEFSYQPLNWNKTIEGISPENIVHAPSGLNNNYQWVDLYNEGIPGILTEQASAWYYKSNLGNGDFTNAMTVSTKPSLSGISSGQLQLQDLDADGSKQIVSNVPGISGFYELSDENEWSSFQSFEQLPVINWQDGHTRLIDLNGDGKADILITEENVFSWYPSAGKRGYDSKEISIGVTDEDKGPAIVFDNSDESIFLADMSGDGLTDIVRIRNGEVSYWPNLGYGKFGAKITMNQAPYFDHPDQFNPAYLHLADISGTGVTDIIYTGKNQFKAWLNLSGNAWSAPCGIDPFFSTESPNQLGVVDLLGNGTACLVWSSPLPANAEMPMRYIDLMSGLKPHIMCSYKNNFGKETRFEYKTSTFYYLEDKKKGNPWITKLPFPVQCVSKVVVTDSVSDLRFTTSYKYHHGYFDHAEREFRGFGMVEQTDTEEFEPLQESGAVNATDIKFHEPPIVTKTWFHLGAFIRGKKILDHFETEYWYNNPQLIAQLGPVTDKEFKLPDALFIGEFTPQELREAHRACKGMMLRQETFSLDNSSHSLLPYSVATHNCHIKKIQPAAKNPFSVFLVQQSEEAHFTYERKIDDPRISHSLNIEIDELGNVLKSVAIVYPRKKRPTDLVEDKIWSEQNKEHILVNENSFTQDVVSSSAYRLRMPYEVKSFEMQGINSSSGQDCYTVNDFMVNATEIAYEKEFTKGLLQKRLIEYAKTLYLNNDLGTVMQEGLHDVAGFAYESYQLAFTDSLLENIYTKENESSRVNTDLLENARYTRLGTDDRWWIRSGTVQFLNSEAGETTTAAAKRFYAPLSYTDPFGSVTQVQYYGNYFLQIEKITDQLANTSIVEKFDFRTLVPVRMKDMNANITEAAIDILGMVVGSAVMGKGEEADDMDGFMADLTQEQVDAFINDPAGNAEELLQHATARIVYDFSKAPCVAAFIVREEHFRINAHSKLQYSFEYSGGLGNTVLKKIQAEAGEAPYRDASGALVKRENGELDTRLTDHRWVGSGRTILNNKGKPVKQYEPYFSDSHGYDTEKELRDTGVTPVLYYDAVGRQVKTEMPDDSFTKVEYDSWVQKSYDANDTTVIEADGTREESKWYSDRVRHRLDEVFTRQGKDPVKEAVAAEKAAVHGNTPTVTHLDSLGRSFYSIAHNKRKEAGTNVITEEFYVTQSILDVEGNLRAVIDACGNTVMSYEYDVLGHQAYQKSMDAGERWMLTDCMGKPTYAWDSKGQQFITAYDELHRPVTTTVIQDDKIFVADRLVYIDIIGLSPGDIQTQQQKNLIGKSIAQYNNAGVTRLLNSDFRGNPLETSRQYAKEYKLMPDWIDPESVALETEVFTSMGIFNALNRPVQLFTPHTDKIPASGIIPLYNEANMLNSMTVKIRQPETAREFIRDIDYDATGQRKTIYYGNNTMTRYAYDDKTFRLIRLLTTGNNGSQIFQDLRYTYDAIGNITHIEDQAFEPIFFNNQRVNAVNEYDYDATYQLIRASGREHAGQTRINETKDYTRENTNFRNFPFSRNDSQAIRGYAESYLYDAVGNILQMQHAAGDGSWTRNYWYNNTDAQRNELGIDAAVIKNNQLLRTHVNNDEPIRYSHDIHGNMLVLPQLQGMQWNYKDQLQQVNLGGGGIAYYMYDNTGQRIRKVVERNANLKEERLYLGAVEIYREKDNTGLVTKQTDTLHIMDDTRRIAMVDTPVNPPANSDDKQVIRFVYSNHLGSSSLELNENGQTISYEEYHPYGTTAYSLSNSDIKVVAKRYRYTGMERDEETGLNYHHARYYAGWLGRWASADSIGIHGGINLFRYSNNSPSVYIDVSGNDSVRGRDISPEMRREGQEDFAVIWFGVTDLQLTPDGHYIGYKKDFVQDLKDMLSPGAYRYFVEVGGFNPNGDWGEMRQSYLSAFSKYESFYFETYGKDTSFLQDYLGYDPYKWVEDADSRGHVFRGTMGQQVVAQTNEYRGWAMAVTDNARQGLLAAMGAANGGKYALELSTMGVAAGNLGNIGISVATSFIQSGKNARQSASSNPQAQPVVTGGSGAAPSKPDFAAKALEYRDIALKQTQYLPGSASLAPMAFGNLIDDAFKNLVQQDIAAGILPSTLRITPRGTYGVDAYDSTTGIGYDLTTSTVRQVAGHDQRYIGKTMPDGTIIKDVIPIVYNRQR